MPTTISTSNEQNPITVNAMLQDPLVIPRMVRTFFQSQYIADQILRPAGNAKGGAVQFWVSDPVYPDVTGGDVEVVAPLGEIPVANPIIGAPDSAVVLKRGLGLRISRELQERNNTGAVLLGLTQIRNSMVRSVDGALMTAIAAAVPGGNVVSVSTPWDAASGTTIRRDLLTGRGLVETLQDTGFNYQLDTLLVNRRTRDDLLAAPEFQATFVGNVADRNPLLDGQLPSNIWGYNILVSPQVPTDKAYLVAKNVLGGIADERGGVEVSDPFKEPAHEATRWNVTRASAGFIDNPNAIVRFDNVET